MCLNTTDANDASNQSQANSNVPKQEIDSHIQQLDQHNSDMYTQAVEALRRIGTPAIPYLVDTFRDSERWLGAVEALAAIGEPAIATLISALDNPATDSFASNALAKIGKPTIPYLIDSLQDQSASIRSWSALILGWLEDRSAIPFLQMSLNDPDTSVRRYAQEALERIAH